MVEKGATYKERGETTPQETNVEWRTIRGMS